MKALSVIAVGAAAVAIVGASAQAFRMAPRTAHAAALIKTVNVTASEFKFVLSSNSAKRGLVIFKVKNTGKLGHDFKINGRKTPVIAPGKSNTLRVTFLRKGAYPYTCTVPGHAAAGMKGIFTIS
jgi:uncharacterized cupredoxin-like copper-binding protein